MFYRVTARLKKETAGSLGGKLADGSIRAQKPDGGEIFDGLSRAAMKESGEVEFSMLCYCSTPLAHERATVFDEHFENLQTEEISGYETHEGRPFMNYLGELANTEKSTGS